MEILIAFVVGVVTGAAGCYFIYRNKNRIIKELQDTIKKLEG